MSIFRKIQNSKDVALLVEERLYEYVAQEIADGDIRRGLWTKASVQSDSATDTDIQRKYIELRVEMLSAEGRLQQSFIEDAPIVQIEEPPTVDQILEITSDDKFVNAAKEEIKTGSIHTSLWIKAKEEAGSSDQAKITSTYIDLRATYLEGK